MYSGRFDSELNIDGFGIINDTPMYIEGKRHQGLKDSEITVTYIGNWRKNNREGLGRSVKVDGNMEFGHYREGIFQNVAGSNYHIGG